MFNEFSKLNEQLEKYLQINEISDDLKSRYFAGRQAQADAALAKLDKARQAIKKSDARQISNLPNGIDKETATDALQDLKYEMKRIDNGSDWRLEEQDNEMVLEVRYWGDWEGDDGSGDYDWQHLSDKSRHSLNNILTKVQKKYGVQIDSDESEKNWLVFSIPITKARKDSTRSYDQDKAWDAFVQKNNAIDKTTTMHKNKGQYVLQFEAYERGGLRELKTYKIRLTKQDENSYTIDYKTTSRMATWKPLIKETRDLKGCLDAAQEFIDKRKASKENPNRKKSVDELFQDFINNASNIWSCLREVMEYYQGSFDGYFKNSLTVKYRYGVPGAVPSAVTIRTDGQYTLYHKPIRGLGELSDIKFTDSDIIEEGTIEKEEYNDMHGLLVKLIKRCQELVYERKYGKDTQ